MNRSIRYNRRLLLQNLPTLCLPVLNRMRFAVLPQAHFCGPSDGGADDVEVFVFFAGDASPSVIEVGSWRRFRGVVEELASDGGRFFGVNETLTDLTYDAVDTTVSSQRPMSAGRRNTASRGRLGARLRDLATNLRTPRRVRGAPAIHRPTSSAIRGPSCSRYAADDAQQRVQPRSALILG